jgi:uncharacterized protein YeeX (DUF496 family)
MKEKVEVQLAWEIWHLISRLNDLIWDYYEDEFIRKNRENTRVLYRDNLKDYLKDDDFVF